MIQFAYGTSSLQYSCGVFIIYCNWFPRLQSQKESFPLWKFNSKTDWRLSLLDGFKASSIKDATKEPFPSQMGWLKESILYHFSAEISTAAGGRASIVSPVRVPWRGEGACSPHLHCTPPPTQVVTVSVHWQSWKQCSWSRWMSQRCAWSGLH